ncbi:hypothetical protein J6590_107509, partial [Homalodisca vitripennis]
MKSVLVRDSQAHSPLFLGTYSESESLYRDATGQGSQGKKKQDWKSGNPFSRKNIKSLYTNKLTAAAPSPSLQTTRRMKQTAEAARLAHPLIAKNPGDCAEKSQGKMKNLVWKSGK